MAKKIERSRIDAGKVALPKKLAFLVSEKVEYLSVTDRDGEFTVEVAAASLARLIKGRAELKQLKTDQKSASKGHADTLAAEQEAHEATKAALTKAERKVQSLTRAAARASQPETAAAPPAKTTRPAKAVRKPKPNADVPGPQVAQADPAPALAAAPADASDSEQSAAPAALP